MNTTWAVNEERIKKEFSELVAIDSVTFSERQMADCLAGKLRNLGFQVTEDQAGERYGGNAGNLYAYLPGTLPGEPVLFSAHMDTVSPGKGKRAVFCEDGRILSGGDTVLGADDLAGVVEILEGVRYVQEAGQPHRGIEILFAIGEEAHAKGTSVFDFSKVKSREAYVLDMSGEIGSAVLQAPSIVSFKAVMRGRAAHAGFEPEKGTNAIQAMSRAIAGIRQGRLDKETTLNIGMISGGEALNIVSEVCTCVGEARSYDHERVLQCVEQAKKVFVQSAEELGASCDFEERVEITAYRVGESQPIVKRFQESCARLGIEPKLVSTFGGSDNNNFVRHGIDGIVLSCGMYQVHSTKEYTIVEELKKGAALVAELISY